MDENPEATLAEYRKNLADVEKDLEANPDNQELLDLKNEIITVIKLAEELVNTPKEATSETTPKAQKSEVTTPKGYVIPKRLFSKPSDTPEQRKDKKRKIHAIKSAYKEQKVNDYFNQQRAEWTKFTKRKRSKISTHKSIFGSTSSAKVGVSQGHSDQTYAYAREKWAYTLPKSGPDAEVVKIGDAEK